MQIKIKDIIFGSLGLIPAVIGFFLLNQGKIESSVFSLILVISLLLILLPGMLRIMIESKKQKGIDSKFLEFTRDLVENVKSGTPISKGIINLRNRNYGVLSNHIQKLANQISLGIPLESSLQIFAKDTKSAVIARSVSLISEAEKAGGRIDTIIESVSNSVNQTEAIKKERRSAIFNLTVQGYIIFIIFVIIMIILQFKILPMMSGFSTTESQININSPSSKEFSNPLMFLLLVQALFSGLFIGKISEGSIKEGIKHSFVLIFLSLLIKFGSEVFLV